MIPQLFLPNGKENADKEIKTEVEITAKSIRGTYIVIKIPSSDNKQRNPRKMKLFKLSAKSKTLAGKKQDCHVDEISKFWEEW